MALKKFNVKSLVDSDTQTTNTISMKLRESKDLSGEGKIEAVLLEQIIPNRYNPRKLPDSIELVVNKFLEQGVSVLDDEAKNKLDSIISESDKKSQDTYDHIWSLAQHISTHGMMSPILITPIGEDKYEVVAGERRYWASRLIGRKVIRAAIRHLDEKQHRVLSISENLAREGLTLKEQVMALVELQSLDASYTKHLAVQQAFGISRSRAFALLKCTKEPYLSQVISGTLTNVNSLSEVKDEKVHPVDSSAEKTQKVSFKANTDSLRKILTILKVDVESNANDKQLKKALQDFIDNL
jgi:ParB/RepB/Spo0J family partition protein